MLPLSLRIGTIYEDVPTDVLGKIGTWQWFVTFVSTAILIPALFNQYEDSFMLQPTNVVCVPPQGVVVENVSLCYVTVESNSSTTAIDCSRWHVTVMWMITLNKSWMVFCARKSILISTAMICRFGLIFGAIVFGLISDSFGRKLSISIDILLSMILEIILIFCDAEGWYRLFVFLKALFSGANLYMGILLVCEIASNGWRMGLMMISIAPRLLSMVCSVPFTNAVLNMETNGFIVTLLYLCCIVLLRWLPESPQWLLFNRKIHVAERILKRAAKMNRIQICENFKIRPVNYRAYNILDETATCVGVLTTYNIRTIFLMTMSIWAVFYFIWSSLYVRIYSEERISDVLLKLFPFVSFFGCLTVLASKRLPLRHLLLIHAILTGAITSTIVFVRNGVLRVVMSSVALSTGLIAHAFIFNITPRLFAINIRATTFGACHATGQLGSTVSYFLYLYQPISDVTFLLVILVCTTVVAGISLSLPNVDGRELPDVMEDMDYYSELSKPLRWATQKKNSPSTEEVEMRIYSFGSRKAVSIGSNSEARLPAQRIGFSKLRRSISEYLRRKFERRK